MFGRILFRSMAKHKGRVALAVVSIIVGVSIASALVSVSSGIEEKIAAEFKAYGANILIVPKSETLQVQIGSINYGSVTEQKYINESDLSALSSLGTTTYEGKIVNVTDRILGYAPYFYTVVGIKGQNAVFVGTNFSSVRRISPWWSVNGTWANGDSDAMIGRVVSEKLGLSIGDSFTVYHNDTKQEHSRSFTVSGIVSTGSSEDEQVFANLGVAQAIAGKPGSISVVQVSANCLKCPIEVITERMQEKLPYAEVRSVKQIAAAEMLLLGKIQSLLVLIAAIGLAASVMGVMSTMTASVLERIKEIGIMKAVGASRKDVTMLIGAEALIVGAVGGMLGYVAGAVLASFIGQQVFGTTIPLNLIAIPISGGVAILVAIIASIIPIRRAVNIQPAIVLRGE
ncbi:MAG: ABC transporter permease [Candidatus Thermoplasmatota archaeon]|nr:ABC transporter permease [Candidatus Thermoplasmatota archaeon]